MAGLHRRNILVSYLICFARFPVRLPPRPRMRETALSGVIFYALTPRRKWETATSSSISSRRRNFSYCNKSFQIIVTWKFNGGGGRDETRNLYYFTGRNTVFQDCARTECLIFPGTLRSRLSVILSGDGS